MEMGTNDIIKRTTLLYRAHNQGIEILESEIDPNDPDVVNIVATGRKARVFYDREDDDISIMEETIFCEPDGPKVKTKHTGRFIGFVAAALTIIYALYLLDYFAGVGTETLGGYIAMSMVSPHMLCVVVAACCSLIGCFGRKRWAMLTCGILMAASAALFPTYAQMVVVQAILFFIAYARMKQ